MSKVLIPNLSTLADVVDRLIVEVNKLSWFENQKREKQAEIYPDLDLIVELDNLSREACEYRSLLKNEINIILNKIVTTGEYKTLKEIRTFRAPKQSVSELIADMADASSKRIRRKLAKRFRKELNG